MVVAVPSELRRLAERSRPVALAGEHLLAVVPALSALLPEGGLRRGTAVRVAGPVAVSLALALAAGPSAAGSWVAVVGLPALGLAAAAELGVVPERLVVVADPPRASWGTVVAAVLGAFDVVVVPAREGRPGPAQGARLAARLRDLGSVAVEVEVPGPGGPARPPGPGLGAEVRLAGRSPAWDGLGAGHGHLRARRVVVEATGRRASARPRRAELWLPGEDGRVALATPAPIPLPTPNRSRDLEAGAGIPRRVPGGGEGA